jgi:quaternary ammonium compound-resistance protein SugE
MAWTYLLGAGVFEIGFTTAMKLDGIWATVLFFVFAALSFWLLTRAMKAIPLGTAYAVWAAIGAVGTAVVGIVAFGDPVTFWRMVFLSAIVVIVVGLKMVSKPEAEPNTSK